MAQLAGWKRKDPIARVERALLKKRVISEKELQAIRREAAELVDRAAASALSAPLPAADAVITQVTA
jgi:TPP-dependent pyruvate/acetoin dehydrogenase alpha subunit